MKQGLYTISENESTELKYKLQFLRLGGSNFPYDLRGQYGYHARRPEWFDVSRYFEVFDKIQLMDGYMLDYFYNMGKLGGWPVLFTRKEGDEHYPNNDQMGELMKMLDHKSSLIKHIGFERSPSGFFQFAVFNIVVHRFYLFWHANYAWSNFLFTKNELRQETNRISREGYLTNRFIVNEIITNPRVEMLNKRDAKIILTMFSIWQGVYYHTTTIEYPNNILNTDSDTLIPYDMGLRF